MARVMVPEIKLMLWQNKLSKSLGVFIFTFHIIVFFITN